MFWNLNRNIDIQTKGKLESFKHFKFKFNIIHKTYYVKVLSHKLIFLKANIIDRGTFMEDYCTGFNS